MMRNQFTLRFLPSGKVRRQGWNEPEMEIIANNPHTKTLILKCRGYNTNTSGIRGMRNDIYTPVTFYAFQLTSEPTCERNEKQATANLLVEWTRKPTD